MVRDSLHAPQPESILSETFYSPTWTVQRYGSNVRPVSEIRAGRIGASGNRLGWFVIS